MDAVFQSKIKEFKYLLQKSNHAVVFSGAGISTPSGIPDFRTPQKGLWTKENPMDVISLTVFKQQPERFFNWLHPLLVDITNAKPNIAHQVIADLQKRGIIKSVITQNIDLLHQQAGSTGVIPIHGTLGSYTCLKCSLKVMDGEPLITNFIKNKILPVCDHCGAYLKPDIVMFEENLPHWDWRKANDEAYKADLLIVVGSSLEVYPANQIPSFALSNQSKIVINTLSSTSLDKYASLSLPYDVTQVWAALADI
jgi:NAD-dependent deacetylase